MREVTVKYKLYKFEELSAEAEYEEVQELCDSNDYEFLEDGKLWSD